jgi:hypothetical protein
LKVGVDPLVRALFARDVLTLRLALRGFVALT